jgi:hypothetical protein
MTPSNLAASKRASASTPSPTSRQSQSTGVRHQPAETGLTPKGRAGDSLGGVFLVIALLLAGSALGGSYYFAPVAERVRHPLHQWLKPSGYVGQTAGILALLIFLFLWLYPLRKRVRWLSWTGIMSRWLNVHVKLALVLPFLAAIHAAWKFDGVIGLGYWSMIVVWLSGIVGRYLYVHIPRGASGLELTAEEIAAERHLLIGEVARTSGLPIAQVETVLRSDPTPLEGVGFMKSLVCMVRDDFARRKAARALRRICGNRPGNAGYLNRKSVREVVRLANREMALSQQARMLGATRAIFRFWHVAHRPFALAALVAVLVHVSVVVVMGATWFW